MEEVTGKPAEERHEMSVLAAVLDPETSRYTAAFQGVAGSVSVLKTKVLEFVNLMTSHETNKMDLDRVQHQEPAYPDGDQWEDTSVWADSMAEETEELNAFAGKCYNCGGVGHTAQECSTKKGKGKGKGQSAKGSSAPKGAFGKSGHKGPNNSKGSGKNKGKGSGPMYGGCFNCQGAHFAKDCPYSEQQGSKGGGKNGSKGSVKQLSSLRTVTPMPITLANQYQALGEIDDVKPEEKSADAEVTEALGQFHRFEAEHRAWKEEIAEENLPGRWRRRKNATQVDNGRADQQRGWVCAQAKHRGRKTAGSLGIFREIVPEQFCNVESAEEWQEVELAVDSGATETVLAPDMLSNISTEEGPSTKKGVRYEVASGDHIMNLGQKRFVGHTEDGEARGLTAQVCDVNKALLSVRRMVATGHRVVFEPTGSYIQDVETGRIMKLRESGGMYMLRLWVQRPGQHFAGQAR